MQDCIFCKIIEGEISSRKVYEDDELLAFYDVSPQAPVHVLVVPKQHVPNIHEARRAGDACLAHLLRTAANVAEQLGLEKTGYRLVVNCGPDARQSVEHLHVHVLGGGQLTETMA